MKDATGRELVAHAARQLLGETPLVRAVGGDFASTAVGKAFVREHGADAQCVACLRGLVMGDKNAVDWGTRAHAEVLAMQDAATQIGSWRLHECTLYVTLEPCAMCAGAIVLSRIPRVVYGTADPKAGAAGSVLDVLDDARLNHRLVVEGGVLASECASTLKSFFARLRG